MFWIYYIYIYQGLHPFYSFKFLKLINNFKAEFIFLDRDNLDIKKNDENDFRIEDILQDDIIKIKLIKKNKINFDFSKHAIIGKRDDLTI